MHVISNIGGCYLYTKTGTSPNYAGSFLPHAGKKCSDCGYQAMKWLLKMFQCYSAVHLHALCGSTYSWPSNKHFCVYSFSYFCPPSRTFSCNKKYSANLGVVLIKTMSWEEGGGDDLISTWTLYTSYLIKKTTRGRVQTFPILRQNSLWTAPIPSSFIPASKLHIREANVRMYGITR